jgi:hypothetical protein
MGVAVSPGGSSSTSNSLKTSSRTSSRRGYTQGEIVTRTGVPLDTVKTRTLAGLRRVAGQLA